ncbi:hypothetical protein EXS45_02165 [Candidatus Nomurabacteria bacterium]|nr:hypothetical protein [Candidatus Nomurabacteria bacterium]
MTPEESFTKEVLWILKEIKKEELLTQKGERVEFSVRALIKGDNAKRKDVDCEFPSKENQKRLLYKLKEWKAIDVEPVDNILRGSDILNPTIYQLIIKQPKFNELYEELREPELKKELYTEKSAEAIKKIIFILDKIKDEWDLIPKNYPTEDSMIQAGIIYRHKKNNRTPISHETTTGWVRECGLKDFYQLDNILDILLEEGLILEATFRGEFE